MPRTAAANPPLNLTPEEVLLRIQHQREKARARYYANHEENKQRQLGYYYAHHEERKIKNRDAMRARAAAKKAAAAADAPVPPADPTLDAARF